ncbi:MAG: hypothetical protein ACI9XO_000024 [Paraglaciecola sp.]|jgi:hypothetical protein
MNIFKPECRFRLIDCHNPFDNTKIRAYQAYFKYKNDILCEFIFTKNDYKTHKALYI